MAQDYAHGHNVFWYNICMRFIDREQEMARLVRLGRERNGGFVAIDFPHRLKEQDRADVFIALHPLQFGDFLKGIALIYGILYQFTPSGGATDDLDRHFDHIFGLQFPGGGAVQYVGWIGLAVRSGGKFHDAGRMKTVEDVE